MKYTCEICGKEATVFWQETVNGHTTSHHFCADCAKSQKDSFWDVSGEGVFLQDPFPSWIGDFFLHGAPSSRTDVCPKCHTSLSQIKESGKFGCAACYDTFAKLLDSRFMPPEGYRAGRLSDAPFCSTENKNEKKREISLPALKKKLQEAVQKEDYESACRLRDEIRRREG